MNSTQLAKLRLSRLFFAATRQADLNTVLNAATHLQNYLKFGDQNETVLKDMENRYILELQVYDNFLADLLKDARKEEAHKWEMSKLNEVPSEVPAAKKVK